MVLLQNTGTPIYQQIADSFRGDILERKIKEGEYLPSIRSLAKDLKISVITTMKAYEQLQSEGLVTPVQGKGYMVNSMDAELVTEQHMRAVEDNLIGAIKAARIAGLSMDEVKTTLETLWDLD